MPFNSSERHISHTEPHKVHKNPLTDGPYLDDIREAQAQAHRALKKMGQKVMRDTVVPEPGPTFYDDHEGREPKGGFPVAKKKVAKKATKKAVKKQVAKKATPKKTSTSKKAVKKSATKSKR